MLMISILGLIPVYMYVNVKASIYIRLSLNYHVRVQLSLNVNGTLHVHSIYE